MWMPNGFVPLIELADELALPGDAVRRWAGHSRVPLFRNGGAGEALLRRRDADRLRDELGASPPPRTTGHGPHAAA